MLRPFAALPLLLATSAFAGPLDVEHVFEDGEPIRARDFNDNFEDVADAVNDNDARIADLEVDGLPSGAVLFFQRDDCPPGWNRLALLEGRVPLGMAQGGTLSATVGDPLGEQGLRRISEVPSHSHSINPPTTSTNNTGSHSHTVDPPSTTTSTNGSHTHVVDIGNGGGSSTHLQGSNAQGDSAIADSSLPIDSAGSHTHTVNISAFSSASAGSHGHTVDIPTFNSASTGTGSVDVTMPYVQLTPCIKP